MLAVGQRLGGRWIPSLAARDRGLRRLSHLKPWPRSQCESVSHDIEASDQVGFSGETVVKMCAKRSML